jgi:PKD repeat protein
VVLTYPTAGTYTVKLTATNEAGQTSVSSKTVRVVDRVLKNIVLDQVYWNPIPSRDPNFNVTWPTTPTADVYVQIQEWTSGTTFPSSGLVLGAPILFTSAVIPAVNYDTSTPIRIVVPARFVFDKRKFQQRKYILSLLARNAEGTYCLFSNVFSGSGATITAESLARNEFNVTTSFSRNSVAFNCTFE